MTITLGGSKIPALDGHKSPFLIGKPAIDGGEHLAVSSRLVVRCSGSSLAQALKLTDQAAVNAARTWAVGGGVARSIRGVLVGQVGWSFFVFFLGEKLDF